MPIYGGGNEVPVVPLDMNNGDIREALLTLDRALTTSVNMGLAPRMNVMVRTKISRFTDFVRMIPPIFLALMWEMIPKSC